MREPQSIRDLVIFQSLSNALYLTLQEKGCKDEQIALFLPDGGGMAVLEVMEMLDGIADKLIAQNSTTLAPIDDAWMVEIANKAVAENMTEDGPAYTSSQGYACAMSALRIAMTMRGDSFAQEQPNTTADSQSITFDAMLEEANQVYTVTDMKYDAKTALRDGLNYIAMGTRDGFQGTDDDRVGLYRKFLAAHATGGFGNLPPDQQMAVTHAVVRYMGTAQSADRARALSDTLATLELAAVDMADDIKFELWEQTQLIIADL